MPGAKTPPRMDEECFGVDLSRMPQEQIIREQINLSYVIDAYQSYVANNDNDAPFFRTFFDKLMGQTYVREMIELGCTNEQIRACWQEDVEEFMLQRENFLLYK